GGAVPRSLRVPRERELATDPVVGPVLVEHDLVAGLEGLVPGGEGLRRLPAELGIATLHQVEAVVVEAEPDVEPVLLDAVPSSFVAAARALSAQAPPELVNGHLEALAPLRGGGELVCRGQGACAATEDGDLRPAVTHGCPA